MPNPRPTYTNLEFDQQFGSKVSKRVPDVVDFTKDTPSDIKASLESLTGNDRLSLTAVKDVGTTSRDAIEALAGSEKLDASYLKNLPQTELSTRPIRLGTDFLTPLISNASAVTTGDYFHNDILWVDELRLFVVATSGPTGRISTSPDGVTWTERTTPLINVGIVIWSARTKTLIAYNIGGLSVLTSTNGTTWTERNLPASSTSRIFEINEKGLFIVGCNVSGTSKIATSSDGITWTARTTGTISTVASVAYSKTQDVIVVNNGFVVLKSTDGITWVQSVSNIGIVPSTAFFVRWIDELGLFVDFSGSGTTRVRTSPDGNTWTARTTPSFPIQTTSGNTILWIPQWRLFVVALDSSSGSTRIMTSPDAITWTLRTTANTNLFNLRWVEDFSIVMCVSGTNVLYSFNGITWVTVVNSALTNFGNFEYSARLGRFVYLFIASTSTTRIKYSEPLFATDTFTTADSKTVVVTNGLITSIIT